MPKVSPPVGSSVTRQSPGNVLDKIQAELAETKRREDELRRARRAMFRSQPDLSKVTEDTALTDPEQTEDNQSDSDIEVSFVLSPVCSLQSPELRGLYYQEDDTPSLMHTRGKSALISVWENRIQCEKAA